MKKNEPYRQYVPTGDLSLERNSDNVPNDDWFYVLENDVVVGRFKSFRQAQHKYIALRDALELPGEYPDSRAARVDILDQYFMEKELYWAESHRFRRGGGKGGRGGI